MKNKVYVLILLLLSCICLKLNVFAAEGATPEHGSDYTRLETEYKKGVVKTNISSEGIVTIYGKSECNGSSCDYTYVGNTKDYKEVLSKSVVCTGGEKYISIGASASGRSEEFKDSQDRILNGTAYWNEEYNVTCTSNSSGDKTVPIDTPKGDGNTSGGNTSGGNTSGGNTSGGNTSGGNTSGGNTSGGDYSSSDTTDTSQTGVSTYFVVLGLVAIISYVFMVLIKKYNLFNRI